MSAIRSLARGAVLALALATSAAAQDGLRWETTLDAAQRTAAATNRLVLVHFGAPWCGPCQRLEQEVFSQPGFGRELQDQFVAVKLNCDHYPATARQFGIERIPADVILSPRGELLHKLPNPDRPYTAAEYVAAMNQVAATLQSGSAQGLARNDMDGHDAVRPAGHNSAIAPDQRYSDYYQRRRNQAGLAAGTPSEPIHPSMPGNGGQVEGDDYCELPRYEDSSLVRDTPSAAHQHQQHAARNMVPDSRYPRQVQASRPDYSARADRSDQQLADRQQPRRTALPPTPQIPQGNPPLGLDGYCPVTLGEKQSWQIGDVRWGAIHRGRTYLFIGKAEQQAFLANPDQYSPVLSGNDPVLAMDRNQAVAGQREFGVFGLDGRVYLFASPHSRDAFEHNPTRYSAEALQARR